MTYKHLSQTERCQISALKKAGISTSQITKNLGRSNPPFRVRLCAILVKEEWSLEQIAGTLQICHETIYRHVYAKKDQGGTQVKHLRSQKKRRRNIPADFKEGGKFTIEDRSIRSLYRSSWERKLDIGKETLWSVQGINKRLLPWLREKVAFQRWQKFHKKKCRTGQCRQS